MKHLLFAIALSACGATLAPAPDAGHQASLALQACHAQTPATVNNAAELVQLINVLPRPVTVPCVVAALPRPLPLVATHSQTSAQPAEGSMSPRIFVMGASLVIAVVPSGAGANLLETGEWVTSTRTIKGELELPVSAPVASDALYTHVATTTQRTTCALCHRDEAPHDTRASAFVSTAYRPNPGEELTEAAVEALHDACVESGETTGRCELLHALYDFGAVRQSAFRREVELFIP
ncbi:MAG: hypothetical protein JNK82_08495 [Myxococcaceae bacterium]|nr:hypothetical protein [Myxococcaceae bacterium]